MAVTPKSIIPAKQAENVQTTQYTAVNCKCMIDKFTVSNVTASPVTFAVNLVANGGAAAATNNVLPTKTIQAGEVYLCPELVGQVIGSGGFISTLAGTAAALVICASGREVT